MNMCVVLFIRHAVRMRRFIISVIRLAVPYFSTPYKRHDFR